MAWNMTAFETPGDLLLQNCRLYHSPQDATVDILVRSGMIARILKSGKLSKSAEVINAGRRFIAPGFIDVHIQGAGGADILDGTLQVLQTISRTLARFGTTAFLATTVVHSHKDNRHIELAAQHTGKNLGGARLLGIHLEGPFINPRRKGGISSDSIYAPSMQALDDILKITGNSLKMMTIAPELEGAGEIISRLVKKGVIASFGHSDATYQETLAGIHAGITHVTHLFNAMPPLHHRIPGPLPAIFEAGNISVQVISDGIHLHPAVINMIYRLLGKDRIICITDGVQAIGLPEGDYVYNGKIYESRNGIARYPDGTLIGTAMSLNRIFPRFMDFTGCSLESSIDIVSRNPARLLGLNDRMGSVEPNKCADLVIFDPDFSVWATIIDGRPVYRRGT
jgi:N-acetylglucosamine-6-phosphate deacetylase